MKEYLSPQELADYFRVTRQTIYNKIREGQLRAIKVGSDVRISKKTIEEYINAHTSNKK